MTLSNYSRSNIRDVNLELKHFSNLFKDNDIHLDSYKLLVASSFSNYIGKELSDKLEKIFSESFLED